MEKSQLKLSWGKKRVKKNEHTIKSCEEVLSIPEISEIRVKKKSKGIVEKKFERKC